MNIITHNGVDSEEIPVNRTVTLGQVREKKVDGLFIAHSETMPCGLYWLSGQDSNSQILVRVEDHDGKKFVRFFEGYHPSRMLDIGRSDVFQEALRQCPVCSGTGIHPDGFECHCCVGTGEWSADNKQILEDL